MSRWNFGDVWEAVADELPDAPALTHGTITLSWGELDRRADDLARWLNPIVAGWMGYYGRFYRSAMAPLLQRVNAYLRRWAGKKYRRLRSYTRFQRWWSGVLARQPALFAQWKWARTV